MMPTTIITPRLVVIVVVDKVVHMLGNDAQPAIVTITFDGNASFHSYSGFASVRFCMYLAYKTIGAGRVSSRGIMAICV